MLFVGADFEKYHVIPVCNLHADRFEDVIHFRRKHRSSVLCRTDDMVEQDRCIMATVDMFTHASEYITRTARRAAGNVPLLIQNTPILWQCIPYPSAARPPQPRGKCFLYHLEIIQMPIALGFWGLLLTKGRALVRDADSDQHVFGLTSRARNRSRGPWVTAKGIDRRDFKLPSSSFQRPLFRRPGPSAEWPYSVLIKKTLTAVFPPTP
jgi:hypothetical protein